MRSPFKLGLALGAAAFFSVAVASPSKAAIVNGGFEQFPDFTGYFTAGAATIQASDFRVPVEGFQQALISTAPAGVTGAPANPVTASALETFLGLGAGSLTSQGATNGSGFKQTTIAAAAGDVISFKYDFYTQEPRPTTSNDFAFVVLNGVLTKLADVNTAVLGAPPATTGSGDNAGINGFAGVRETGFLTSSVTVGAAGTYTLGFGVVNVLNTNVQSGLLVDAITQAAGPGGGGGAAVPLPAGVYLMPVGLALAGMFSAKMRRPAVC